MYARWLRPEGAGAPSTTASGGEEAMAALSPEQLDVRVGLLPNPARPTASSWPAGITPDTSAPLSASQPDVRVGFLPSYPSAARQTLSSSTFATPYPLPMAVHHAGNITSLNASNPAAPIKRKKKKAARLQTPEVAPSPPPASTTYPHPNFEAPPSPFQPLDAHPARDREDRRSPAPPAGANRSTLTPPDNLKPRSRKAKKEARAKADRARLAVEAAMGEHTSSSSAGTPGMNPPTANIHVQPQSRPATQPGPTAMVPSQSMPVLSTSTPTPSAQLSAHAQGASGPLGPSSGWGGGYNPVPGQNILHAVGSPLAMAQGPALSLRRANSDTQPDANMLAGAGGGEATGTGTGTGTVAVSAAAASGSGTVVAPSTLRAPSPARGLSPQSLERQISRPSPPLVISHTTATPPTTVAPAAPGRANLTVPSVDVRPPSPARTTPAARNASPQRGGHTSGASARRPRTGQSGHYSQNGQGAQSGQSGPSGQIAGMAVAGGRELLLSHTPALAHQPNAAYVAQPAGSFGTTARSRKRRERPDRSERGERSQRAEASNVASSRPAASRRERADRPVQARAQAITSSSVQPGRDSDSPRTVRRRVVRQMSDPRPSNEGTGSGEFSGDRTTPSSGISRGLEASGSLGNDLTSTASGASGPNPRENEWEAFEAQLRRMVEAEAQAAQATLGSTPITGAAPAYSMDPPPPWTARSPPPPFVSDNEGSDAASDRSSQRDGNESGNETELSLTLLSPDRRAWEADRRAGLDISQRLRNEMSRRRSDGGERAILHIEQQDVVHVHAEGDETGPREPRSSLAVAASDVNARSAGQQDIQQDAREPPSNSAPGEPSMELESAQPPSTGLRLSGEPILANISPATRRNRPNSVPSATAVNNTAHGAPPTLQTEHALPLNDASTAQATGSSIPTAQQRTKQAPRQRRANARMSYSAGDAAFAAMRRAALWNGGRLSSTPNSSHEATLTPSLELARAPPPRTLEEQIAHLRPFEFKPDPPPRQSGQDHSSRSGSEASGSGSRLSAELATAASDGESLLSSDHHSSGAPEDGQVDSDSDAQWESELAALEEMRQRERVSLQQAARQHLAQAGNSGDLSSNSDDEDQGQAGSPTVQHGTAEISHNAHHHALSHRQPPEVNELAHTERTLGSALAQQEPVEARLRRLRMAAAAQGVNRARWSRLLQVPLVEVPSAPPRSRDPTHMPPLSPSSLDAIDAGISTSSAPGSNTSDSESESEGDSWSEAEHQDTSETNSLSLVSAPHRRQLAPAAVAPPVPAVRMERTVRPATQHTAAPADGARPMHTQAAASGGAPISHLHGTHSGWGLWAPGERPSSSSGPLPPPPAPPLLEPVKRSGKNIPLGPSQLALARASVDAREGYLADLGRRRTLDRRSMISGSGAGTSLDRRATLAGRRASMMPQLSSSPQASSGEMNGTELGAARQSVLKHISELHDRLPGQHNSQTLQALESLVSSSSASLEGRTDTQNASSLETQTTTKPSPNPSASPATVANSFVTTEDDGDDMTSPVSIRRRRTLPPPPPPKEGRLPPVTDQTRHFPPTPNPALSSLSENPSSPTGRRHLSSIVLPGQHTLSQSTPERASQPNIEPKHREGASGLGLALDGDTNRLPVPQAPNAAEEERASSTTSNKLSGPRRPPPPPPKPALPSRRAEKSAVSNLVRHFESGQSGRDPARHSSSASSSSVPLPPPRPPLPPLERVAGPRPHPNVPPALPPRMSPQHVTPSLPLQSFTAGGGIKQKEASCSSQDSRDQASSHKGHPASVPEISFHVNTPPASPALPTASTSRTSASAHLNHGSSLPDSSRPRTVPLHQRSPDRGRPPLPTVPGPQSILSAPQQLSSGSSFPSASESESRPGGAISSPIPTSHEMLGSHTARRHDPAARLSNASMASSAGYTDVVGIYDGYHGSHPEVEDDGVSRPEHASASELESERESDPVGPAHGSDQDSSRLPIHSVLQPSEAERSAGPSTPTNAMHERTDNTLQAARPPPPSRRPPPPPPVRAAQNVSGSSHTVGCAATSPSDSTQLPLDIPRSASQEVQTVANLGQIRPPPEVPDPTPTPTPPAPQTNQAPLRIVVPAGAEVTELDVLARQLEEPGDHYELLTLLGDILGPASAGASNTEQLVREAGRVSSRGRGSGGESGSATARPGLQYRRPPVPTEEEIETLPVAPVELVYRRTTPEGRTKQKLEVTGVRVETCAICVAQFRPTQMACIFPCVHVFHADCARRLLLHSRTCPLCRHDIAEAPPA